LQQINTSFLERSIFDNKYKGKIYSESSSKIWIFVSCIDTIVAILDLKDIAPGYVIFGHCIKLAWMILNEFSSFNPLAKASNPLSPIFGHFAKSNSSSFNDPSLFKPSAKLLNPVLLNLSHLIKWITFIY